MFAAARQKLEQRVNQPDREEPSPPLEPTPNHNRWTLLVERICEKDDTAIEELYRIFSKGIRYHICRQLGSQELDDKVHDTFLIVIQAIQKGDLREPERLMGFVRTIVRRQIAVSIGRAIQNRREHTDLEEGSSIPDLQKSPEETAIIQQNIEIARKALKSISNRDREILTRFYIDEESQEKICLEMDLSETQFRLLKSRAKARFGESGKKNLLKTPIRNFFYRK